MDYQFLTIDMSNNEKIHSFEKTIQEKHWDNDLATRVWWCLENPLTGKFVCAIHKKVIVATARITTKKIIIGENQFTGVEIGDTYTSIEHRRQGLFTKLVKIAEKEAIANDAELVYGTPNENSEYGYIKLGYDIVGKDKSSIYKKLYQPYKIDNKYSYNIYDIEKYISDTISFPRLNQSNYNVLKWRFNRPNVKFMFAKFEYKSKAYHVCFREGLPGPVKAFIIVEAFCNNEIITQKDIVPIIDIISNECKINSTFLFHFYSDSKTIGSLSGVEKYRSFPINVKFFSVQKFISSKDWFKHYHFTDSDYA
jgi:hypothetical protein